MIALISKDAGGAELVSRYIKKLKEKYCISITGPAIKIYRKNKIFKKNLKFQEAIKKSEWILSSTGESNFEKNAMEFAKKNKKKVVAYIDHWTNYKERFRKNKKLIKPDEVWVVDKQAKMICKKNKLQNVKIKHNPFFDSFIKFKKKYKNKENKNILFLSEPVNNSLKKYYNEIDCLKFFIKNLHKTNLDYKKIIIRPHPSEKKTKFKKFLKLSKNIFISNRRDIFYDIISNKIIVGINTQALVLGLLAKKKVITCVPIKNKFELPHKKILFFNDLINEKN
jgi:hypothetical protein